MDGGGVRERRGKEGERGRRKDRGGGRGGKKGGGRRNGGSVLYLGTLHKVH